MPAIKFNPYKKNMNSTEEPKSGVFEKPHKIIVKTVTVDGEQQQHPVKVYEPTKTVEPTCNPVHITMWAEGIVRSRRGSE
jgi:hypothetical protein